MMKILVLCDGTVQSKDALLYGMRKVQEQGGLLIAMYVFNSLLFIDYDATPDALALARADAERHVAEAAEIIRKEGNGICAYIVTAEGNPEESAFSYARERFVDLVLCPPRYWSLLKNGTTMKARKDEGFYQYTARTEAAL